MYSLPYSHADECITGTNILVTSPTCPKFHRQATMFPQLRRLDLCKGPKPAEGKRPSRRPPGGLLRDGLQAVWNQILSLKINAFTGPPESPSLGFPRGCFQKLQILELHTCDINAGDLISLSQVSWPVYDEG